MTMSPAVLQGHGFIFLPLFFPLIGLDCVEGQCLHSNNKAEIRDQNKKFLNLHPNILNVEKTRHLQ
jgi:hypothetical protein